MRATWFLFRWCIKTGRGWKHAVHACWLLWFPHKEEKDA